MAMPAVLMAVEEFTGVDIDGESSCLFSINPGLIWHFIQSGNQEGLEMTWCVPDVCKSPAGIWRGLKREGYDNALIYAGIPTGEFSEDHGHEIETVENGTFVVYVHDALVDDRQVLRPIKWTWVPIDPEIVGFPEGHTNRFGRRLWPT